MTIKITIVGSHGKMGSCAREAFKNDLRFTLAEGVDKDDDLNESIQTNAPDVVVDLTAPEAVFANAKVVLSNKIPLVIGASGLGAEQVEWLQSYCADHAIGAAIIPNFSLGAALMVRMAELAAPVMPDVDIIEYHHKQKKDAPSATANFTAERIREAQRQAKVEDVGVHIQSVRNNGFVAAQEVVFGQIGERLVIKHETLERSAFMPGLLLVCTKVLQLNSLVVGLDKFL